MVTKSFAEDLPWSYSDGGIVRQRFLTLLNVLNTKSFVRVFSELFITGKIKYE